MAEAEEPARQAVLGRARQRRLLLVEDDVELRGVMRGYLEKRGFECRAAGDAEGAARLLEDGAGFDIVVSDVRLPGASGLELAARIRTEWPGLPVLLVSGSGDGRVLAVARRLGVSFLAKPFLLPSLLAAILDVLETSSSNAPP